MPKCLFCDIEISDQNISIEHVIPNAIGGTLTHHLICRDCNSKFGATCDADLVKDLHFFAAMIGHKRDRKKIPNIEAFFESKKIKLDNNFNPSNTLLTRVTNNRICVTCLDIDPKVAEQRARRQAIDVFTKLKKRGKLQLTKEEFIQKLNKNISKFKIENPGYEFNISFNNVWPGLIKIATNYAILCGIQKEHLTLPLKILDGKQVYGDFVNFYYQTNFIRHKNGRFYHEIHLIADPVEGLLYAFISLYGVLQGFILLSNEYNGPRLSKAYCFNLTDNHEDSPLPINTIKRSDLIGILSRSQELDVQNQLSIQRAFDDFFYNCKINFLISLTKELASEFKKNVSSDLSLVDKNIFISRFTDLAYLRKSDSKILIPDERLNLLIKNHVNSLFNEFVINVIRRLSV